MIVAAQDGTMSFYWLAIRTNYLCSIAETVTKKRRPSSDRDDAAASGDLDPGPTPWEKWNHRTAYCVEIEHPLAAPTPAGGRWLLHSQPLVVREFKFGLSRSRSIPAEATVDRIQRIHRDNDSDQGTGKAVLRETLQDAFASQLPYCDITVSMGERKYQSVIADHEWVIGLNNEVRAVQCSAPLCGALHALFSLSTGIDIALRPETYTRRDIGRRFFQNDASYRYPSHRIDS
jgi:hypothetical protein